MLLAGEWEVRGAGTARVRRLHPGEGVSSNSRPEKGKFDMHGAGRVEELPDLSSRTEKKKETGRGRAMEIEGKVAQRSLSSWKLTTTTRRGRGGGKKKKKVPDVSDSEMQIWPEPLSTEKKIEGRPL